MWTRRQRDRNGTTEREDLTFLGESINFKGVASFVGTVRIDGQIEGEIYTNGRVEVGTNAVIKGTITAGTLISNGRINGSVTAGNKVQLLRSSVLIGEVHAPVFYMEEGAHFEGICRMRGRRQAETEETHSSAMTDPVQVGNPHPAILKVAPSELGPSDCSPSLTRLRASRS